MSWLKKVSAPRAQAANVNAEVKGPAKQPAKQEKVGDVDAFAATRASEKVIAQAGANLRGAIPDMTAIADAADRMEPHRAAQLGRAVETYYLRLAKDVARMPAGERNGAAEASVRALRALVEHIPHDELAGSAVSAMTDLIRYVAQSVHSRDPLSAKLIGDASEAAKNSVIAMIDATEGRAGSASALNIFPNIVWQMENAAPAAGKARFDRWSAIANFVAEALPKPRIDQIAVAKLGAAVSAELENKADQGALDRAKKKLFEEAALGLAPARAQAALVPPGVAADQPSFNAMSKAMIAVIDANPAGPGSLGAAVEALAARITDLLARAGAEEQPAWIAIADLITRAAPTPAAEAVLGFLTENVQALVDSPAARAELAAPGADPAAKLVRARAAQLGAGAEALAGALAKFDALHPATKIEAAIASLPHLGNAQVAPALIEALAVFAKSAPAAGLDAQVGFAQRFTAIYPDLWNRLGDQRAGEVASAVARANPGAVLAADKAQAIAATCSMVAAAMPDAPLAALMNDDAEKRAGLASLSNTPAYRFDPRNYLTGLLQKIAPLDSPAPVKLALVRFAMHLAGELGKLDRDPGGLYQTALRDLEAALAAPDQLHFAARAGGNVRVRGGQARKNDGNESIVAKFIAEHAELPPELALTAGVHLSNDQMTWLLAQVTTQKSRAQIRNIRDAIYAAMDANRLDIVESMRTSKSPPAAIATTMTFIAAEYRGGRFAQIPWDQISAGLNAGEDPGANIEKERAKVALAALNLQELGAGKAVPAGLEILQKVMPDIRGILAVLPPGRPAYGVPSEQLRDPFLACLRGTADGTWPKGKYETEIGRRQLAKLTPQQREIWMSEGVTPLNAQPAQAAGPELADAMTIMKGLGAAIRKEAKLSAPGMELAFDAPSRDKLRAEVAKLSGELHQAAKGTPEHRGISQRIGPMMSSLAVIELVLALDEQKAKPPADPAAAISGMKALLTAAKPAARKLGARGSAEAMQRILDVAPAVKTSPKTGIYAADEDRVDAYVTAFDGGCMRAQGGGNQGGQVEFITSAQYKMVRACSGEVGATRSVMRLLDVELPNYKGPAIWLDGPYPTNRGVAATPEMYKLAYKHAYAKAMAMGVPFMYGPIGYGAGKDQGAPAMQELGVNSVQQQVTVAFDVGTTGLHHCQSLLGDQSYWVHSPGYAVAYVTIPAGETTYKAGMNASVVMPPGR